MPSDRNPAGRTRWVDLQSAIARTGLSREHIVWAMASGEVRYSTSLADHEGLPRLALADVESLARQMFKAEPRNEGSS